MVKLAVIDMYVEAMGLSREQKCPKDAFARWNREDREVGSNRATGREGRGPREGRGAPSREEERRATRTNVRNARRSAKRERERESEQKK